MNDELLSPRRQIARHLAQTYAELAGIEDAPGPRFSLARAVAAMATGGLRSGFEKEICSGTALARDTSYDPSRITIPWSAIARRDMTVAGVSGSNYLVGTATATAADALRPWSVSMQAGVTLFENLRENLKIPRVSGDVTGAWLAGEAASATAADPTLSAVALTPKTWISVVEFSHQFLRQADQAENFIRAQLLRVAGRALDAAILGGSGASGQPQGIVNVTGIGSVSGASLDNADVLEMRETVATAGANDARVAWVSTPAVRQVLAAREAVATSGRMLWQDDRIDNRAAYATPDAPASTLILADFTQVAVALWGPGLQIQVNPQQDFSRGIIAARVLLDVDVAVLQAGAVCVAAALT